jgi:tetratricopeptide (TPR) repeat protein
VARNPVKKAPAPAAPPSPRAVIGSLVGAGAVLFGLIFWVSSTREPVHDLARPAADRPVVRGESSPAPPPQTAAEPSAAPAFLDPAGAGAMAYTAGNYDEALAQYQAAVERNPEDAESHSNLGQVLVRLNRPGEAIPHFDRALQLIPDRWAYQFNRARALGLLNRWDEAVEGYRRAQQLFPDDYATAFNLGQALHKKGEEAAAVEQYQRAIALDPSDASFRLALGISYERLEKKAEAAAAYSEYLKMAPDAPDADVVRERLAALAGAS